MSFAKNGFVALLACTVISGISGCAAVETGKQIVGFGSSPAETVDPLDVDGMSVDDRIADAVEKTANATAAVAEVEVAAVDPVRPGPGHSLAPTAVLPPELMQAITVNHVGPVEGLMKSIADIAGYEFRVIGKPPATLKNVVVKAQGEVLYAVARSAAAQVHGFADVVINPTARLVEIRYGG